MPKAMQDEELFMSLLYPQLNRRCRRCSLQVSQDVSASEMTHAYIVSGWSAVTDSTRSLTPTNYRRVSHVFRDRSKPAC